jgi:hypothetical protein
MQSNPANPSNELTRSRVQEGSLLADEGPPPGHFSAMALQLSAMALQLWAEMMDESYAHMLMDEHPFITRLRKRKST